MQKKSGKPIVLVDIDGTLADVRHRLYHIRDGRKKNWKGFFEGMDRDTPIASTVAWVRSLAQIHDIIIITGRPEEYRARTVAWLKQNEIPFSDMFMRRDGDHRPDYEIKQEALERWPKERIKLAIELAWEHGRKVAFIGRSMNSSAEIAEDLGYIEIPEGLLIHPGEMKNYPPEKVCVLISGTQGEPMSALSRAAVDNHKHAKIEKGDTVVLSSRIIPGNEKAIYRMIDHLFRRESHVIYEDGSSPPVHVSGHASQEELKLIINLVKPKYFIPIHGEYRQLKLHAELAGAMHGSVGNVILLESGEILEFDELGARKVGRVNVGRVCIDSGSRTDVVEDLIIKDRRHLSEDGIVLPIIAINKLTGRVETSPEMVSRGFAPGEDGFMDGARQIVMQTLEQSSDEEKADYGVIKEKIRADLKRYISKQTQKRPLIRYNLQKNTAATAPVSKTPNVASPIRPNHA